MQDILIFDKGLKRKQLARASRSLASADYLLQEAAARLCDRLEGINRQFTTALELGSRGPFLHQHLPSIPTFYTATAHSALGGHVVCDEEALPFAAGQFSLLLSLLNLHWANDLPGALVQMRRLLSPDGLLLASMLGGNTLHELRTAQVAAESQLMGGISPRISPFTDAREMAGLLQRAGFALPVADTETITAIYPDAHMLMRDLRAMGENNALLQRPKTLTSRRLLNAIAEEYQKKFGTPEGIPATFEIITITGWAN